MDLKRIVRAVERRWPLLLAIGVGVLGLIHIAPYLYFGIGFAYELATLRPLNWDVVEPKGSDCQLTDAPAIRNKQGVEAVLRFANCPGDFAQGTAYNVVFVHAFGQPNARSNLVFQYTPGFEGDNESPPSKLAWKGRRSLEITAPGVIDSIEVQKDEIFQVRLTYKLGRQPPSPSSFQLFKKFMPKLW